MLTLALASREATTMLLCFYSMVLGSFGNHSHCVAQANFDDGNWFETQGKTEMLIDPN